MGNRGLGYIVIDIELAEELQLYYEDGMKSFHLKQKKQNMG